MIVQEILTAQFDPESELDRILAELCEMVLAGQQKDPEYFGMVAACVICSDGTRTFGINHATKGGLRVHAERAALDKTPNPGPECIVVTTLSPCNTPRVPDHRERYGEDCQQLLDDLGIAHVYCGYKNPQEDPDTSIQTKNAKILELCQRFADTFLDEARKKKRKSRGGGGGYFFPGYGYYGGGAGEGGGDGGGGGESKSGMAEGLTPNTIHKLADRKGIKWDNEPNFLALTKRLTGKEHLDDLNQEELLQVKRHLEKQDVAENFVDGRVKGKSRPGRVKRAGASCKGSVTSLRSKAKNASGERAKMYHWCANMKAGRKK